MKRSRSNIATREAAVVNAWRIHDAQADWTGKVDAKASFSFGIQSAIIATVIALTAEDKLFDNFQGWWVALFLAGVLLLMSGAFMSALVVAPILRSKNLNQESRDNFIYFGHLRYWNGHEERLQRKLLETDLLAQLTLQLTRTAEIAWKKHVKVRLSIWFGMAGGFVLVVCGLVNRFQLGS